MIVSTVLGISITAFFIFYLILKLKYLCDFVKKVNKFPGRKGYPIIGNVLDFFGPPDVAFQAVTSYVNEFVNAGACRVWMFKFPVIVISGPEDMEKTLGSAANNTKGFFYECLRPWLGYGLLTSAGQKWHVRRKMLTPTFHFNILLKYMKVFNAQSKNFVENMKMHANTEVDIVPAITKFTLDSICQTAMGISLDHSKNGDEYRNSVYDFGMIVFERVQKTWLMLELIYRFTTTYWKQRRITKILHNFSSSVISNRKMNFDQYFKDEASWSALTASGKKQMAMLDLLVLAQKRGEDIDNDGIREEVDTFMFEGHDTTSMSICFTLMLLANNNHCQDKIYEEITSVVGIEEEEPTYLHLQQLKYMERCIKESLRLYPSVPLISRKVGEDVSTHNGLVIPKGCTIVATIYHMHRRADLYPDPEKFDPDRFLSENTTGRHPYAYIPFSAGPRNCIGQKFAMTEIKCLLLEIFKNYTLEPIDTPESTICITDLVIRPKNPIRMKFVQRN